jgi:hypothetical protein
VKYAVESSTSTKSRDGGTGRRSGLKIPANLPHRNATLRKCKQTLVGRSAILGNAKRPAPTKKPTTIDGQELAAEYVERPLDPAQSGRRASKVPEMPKQTA